MWAPGVGGNYNSWLCEEVSGGRGGTVPLARGEVCLLQGSTRCDSGLVLMGIPLYLRKPSFLCT